MELHQSQEWMPDQPGMGRNRPIPSFAPLSAGANEAELQENAGAGTGTGAASTKNVAKPGVPNYSPLLNAGAPKPLKFDMHLAAGAPNIQKQAMQPVADVSKSEQPEAPLDEPTAALSPSKPASLPQSAERGDYIIPVEEVLIRLREFGIEKSKDSVQRYCREGALDCQKLGLFKRYFATEKSLAALIEKMQPDEDARACIQAHPVASTSDVTNTNDMDAPASSSKQAHQAGGEPEEKPNTETEPETDQTAQTKTTIDEAEPKTTGDKAMMDFLKDEIRVKNKQLEVKDTQIAAMLERDHETNILIRGLQNQLGETFAMLSGRANREETKQGNVREH